MPRKKRKFEFIKLLPFLAIALAVAGILGCIGCVSFFAGNRALACCGLGAVLGAAGFIEANLSKRNKIWGVLGVLAMAMSIGGIVAKLQG